MTDTPSSTSGSDLDGHAFWGQGNNTVQSLLHQLALQVAKRS